MQSTSLDKSNKDLCNKKLSKKDSKELHKEGKYLFQNPTELAGLAPADFDKALVPIRKYLEQFDEDGKLGDLMLVQNVTNHLVDGLYVRELLIPKGSFIISRVHKRALVNIISTGKVVVVDSNGINEYTAPSTFISKSGTQRIVIAIEESVWNTVHKTDVTDTDDLVNDLTSDNYSDHIAYKQLTYQE